MSYAEFIASKSKPFSAVGFGAGELCSALFPFQRAIVAWAVRRGRAAIFAECGLGKSIMQIAWADAVARHTGGRVVILAPLAVAEQTIAEGARFGIACGAPGSDAPIIVTNYERLHRIDAAAFAGVVLDESSILKSFAGKTRTQIIDAFSGTPYRLACTATPAPNDHMELGNHAEFLGICSRVEMLATYFCHDGGETQAWRLKGHAEDLFWRWCASWAACVRRPSDIGFDDAGFNLPPMAIETHVLESGITLPGRLFADAADGIVEQRAARKATIGSRVAKVAELVASEAYIPWLVWCELNAEGDALEDACSGAVQVAGADDDDAKIAKMRAFATGEARVLVTKSSICGFGMNWQHCARVAFVGSTYSYEQFYQSIRRCWRFGQRMPVVVHVVTTDIESGTARALKRKAEQHEEMASEMSKHMIESMRENILSMTRQRDAFAASKAIVVPSWIGVDA